MKSRMNYERMVSTMKKTFEELNTINPLDIVHIGLAPDEEGKPNVNIISVKQEYYFRIEDGKQVHCINEWLRKITDLEISFQSFKQYDELLRKVTKKLKNCKSNKNTFEDLYKVKFDVVEHFGMLKNGEFFIINTVPPVVYGADCKDYITYKVDVKTQEDITALKKFIKDMFGVKIYATELKTIIKEVDALYAYFEKVIPATDWGACHIRELPISDLFKKDAEDIPVLDNLTNTTALVKDILTEIPASRDSDNLLFYMLCERVLKDQGIEVNELSFKKLFLHLKDFGLPQFETVGRVRRKLQQTFPEFHSSKKVSMNRGINADTFLEFAKEGLI